MLESKFKGEIHRLLRQQGAMVYPLMAGRLSPEGWPDTLVWHEMWCGLIEFKGVKTRVEPHQASIISRLNRLRPKSAVVVRDDDHERVQILTFIDDCRHDLGDCSRGQLLFTLREWSNS